MKTIDIKSTYPGFANGYVMYEGLLSTVSDGTYGAGVSIFNINTEIKNNLSVLIVCTVIPVDPNTPDSQINYRAGELVTYILPYAVEAGTDGSSKIIVKVPYGCTANYRISGEKNISKYLNNSDKEVTKVGTASGSGYAYLSHKHDDIDSSKILLTNVRPSYGVANKYVRVSADGNSFVYADSTSTLPNFSLLTPLNNAVLDKQVASTNFTWETCTGATVYELVITQDGALITVESGLFTSKTILHSLFDEASSFEWNVTASDGSEVISAVQRVFTTNLISD